MKVAMVNRLLGFTRGGGEMWDLNMARELEQLSVDVTFVIAAPLTGNLPNPVEAFDTIEISTPHLRDIAYAAPIGVGGVLTDIDSLFFSQRVAARLKESDHDIIHVNSDPWFGRIVDRFDRPVTIKMNGPPHSLWHDCLNPLSSSYDFFPRFDALIATGITTQKIEQHTDCEVTTINPGVDTNQFSPRRGAETDRENEEGKRILWVGRFVPAKNVPLLLEAFSDIHERFPSSKLTLVGEGPLKPDIENKVREMGLDSAITMPGYVSNNQLPEYYRDADVFVLSSRTENHPIVLLEAMGTATPVIAPEIGWIPEMVEDDLTGILYEADSKQGLVDSLDTLLSDSRLRHEIGQRARKATVDNFNWERKAEQFKRLLKKVIGS